MLPCGYDARSITLSGAIGPCKPGETSAEVQAAITQQTTYAAANGAGESRASQIAVFVLWN
jgi:hypothetical protein